MPLRYAVVSAGDPSTPYEPYEPDALPRVIGRSDALARGLSRAAIEHRLRTGRWRRMLPHTYLTADTLTDLDRLNGALAFAGPGAALSGAAALYAGGVERVAMPARLLVIVPASVAARTTGRVQLRVATRPFEVELAPGPRRVQVARAVADLAVTQPRLDDVRALVARVIQRSHCTLAELGAELDAGPVRGSAHLRRALTEIGWGAASAPEAQAASLLRHAGVTGFEQNARLRLPDGRWRYVDFYWAALRACLEIDSIDYHFERADYLATLDRHLDLTKYGYSVIHRGPSALAEPDRFVRDIRDWLAGREADLRRGLG